ncbi:MAG: AMP-binding protein [Betaproteobacteria bacterium]
MKLPLATYRAGSDPFMIGPGGIVSASSFFDRAAQLAAALPDAPYVINLSESRLAFMLGFAAALMRGQSSLLPSGQGPGDWQKLGEQYPGAAVIADRAIDAPGAFDLRPYMNLEASHSALNISSVDADFAAAILFTSGSTGQPAPHTKTWGQLVAGAQCLSTALAWPRRAGHAVVGSVPPQHMFGLESTVMLPWFAGVPMHAGKPLLAADLETAIAQCARPCWWMTTPVHLRPSLQAGAVLPQLAGIVASTMSLPPKIARESEARWKVPVVEIYGSTETGALATRRTANETMWTPLEGVRLSAEPGAQVSGGGTQWMAIGNHIETPVPIADELRMGSDGRFEWLGRAADMLKIGGKRASLAALNQQICDIPGVEDAAFFVPDGAADSASHDDAHPARRLAAFYVSSTLTPGELQAALRARVDPVFVPRPLFRVVALPRNATGKIPQAALAALHSESARSGATAETHVVRERIVPHSHPVLAGHFPGNPIVPGAMILAFVAEDIRKQFPNVNLGALISMRFHLPLRPGVVFGVFAKLQGSRIAIEVRTHPQQPGGEVLASGQWACLDAPAGSGNG